MVRAESVRVYFDADVLGLAKVLCALRADFTYPGDPGGRIKKRIRPPCPITAPGTLDEDWIPLVAEQGWLVVSRDRHIRDRVRETDAVREHRAKMVNFVGAEATNTWTQLEIFMARWRDITALIDEPGPFIVPLTRSGALKPFDLN